MTTLVYQSLFQTPRAPTPPVPQGTEWSPPAAPLRQPRFMAAAMVATGLFLVPGAIAPAAAQQPLGYEPAPQAAPLKQPGLSNAAQAAAGALLVPGAISPTAAALPLGFEPAPQAFTTWPSRRSAPAALVPPAGLSLPPQPIEAFKYGWSNVASDLPYLRHPGGSLAGPSLAAQVVQPFNYGWSLALPDLPQFKRTIGAIAGADLPPEPVPPFYYGWSVATPELPNPKHPGGGTLAGPTLPPQVVEAFVTGWWPVTADLPAFRRKQALPEFTSRIDQPATVVAAYPYGWSVALPDLPHLRYPIGSVAGAHVPPGQIAPFYSGWPATSADLPQFRRKQALPELSGRLDQPAELGFPAFPYGWTVSPPDLPHLRFPQGALAGPVLAPQRIELARPNNWSVVLHEVRHPAYPAAALAGAHLPPSRTAQPLPNGWAIVLHEQLFPRHPSGSLAGPLLPPQLIIRPYPNGWSVALPDIPAFRRKQALPELARRLDAPVAVEPVPRDGWVVVNPDLARTFQHLPALLAGADLAFAYQRQDGGWNIVIPDLGVLRRLQWFSILAASANQAWVPSELVPPLPPVHPGPVPIYVGLGAYRVLSGLPDDRRLIGIAPSSVVTGLPNDRRLVEIAPSSVLTGLDKKPT